MAVCVGLDVHAGNMQINHHPFYLSSKSLAELEWPSIATGHYLLLCCELTLHWIVLSWSLVTHKLMTNYGYVIDVVTIGNNYLHTTTTTIL